MSAFQSWMKKTQPLLCAPGADKVWPCVAEGMEAAWNAAIEAAADACKQWGLGKVEKWEAIGEPEMVTDAKARAWDALQCAAAVRALNGKY